MKPKQQRIAIAELCGTVQPHFVPDYLCDLNAMHEAEKALTPEQRADYMNWLGDCNSERSAVHATASQRAEAFLRTMGRWEE